MGERTIWSLAFLYEGVDMGRFRWADYIEKRKDVLQGKPVFKGTRLSVELVLKALGAGTSQDDLLKEFPSLKPDHIRASILYAVGLLP